MGVIADLGRKKGRVIRNEDRGSVAPIDGLLLSKWMSSRPTFGGIVEVSSWHPYRFVDVLEYGRGSRDPVEVLIREGSTRGRGVLDWGQGLIL